jgi:hypothetical protein
MSNRNHLKDAALSAQCNLFDTGLPEGSLDVALGFRQCLSRVLHSCGKDRYHVAAEVSRLMGWSFSKDMLDKYTGSNQEYGIRAEALTALCHVTGTMEPFRYLLEPLGSDVLNPQDRDLLDLARLLEEQKRIETQIMQIRAKRGLK